jgi:hypothetical protein
MEFESHIVPRLEYMSLVPIVYLDRETIGWDKGFRMCVCECFPSDRLDLRGISSEYYIISDLGGRSDWTICDIVCSDKCDSETGDGWSERIGGRKQGEFGGDGLAGLYKCGRG